MCIHICKPLHANCPQRTKTSEWQSVTTGGLGWAGGETAHDSRLVCPVRFGPSTLPEAVRPIFWTLLPPTERAVGEVCGTKSGRPGVQLGFGSALWDPEQVMELLPQTQSKD